MTLIILIYMLKWDKKKDSILYHLNPWPNARPPKGNWHCGQRGFELDMRGCGDAGILLQHPISESVGSRKWERLFRCSNPNTLILRHILTLSRSWFLAANSMARHCWYTIMWWKNSPVKRKKKENFSQNDQASNILCWPLNYIFMAPIP